MNNNKLKMNQFYTNTASKKNEDSRSYNERVSKEKKAEIEHKNEIKNTLISKSKTATKMKIILAVLTTFSVAIIVIFGAFYIHNLVKNGVKILSLNSVFLVLISVYLYGFSVWAKRTNQLLWYLNRDIKAINDTNE